MPSSDKFYGEGNRLPHYAPTETSQKMVSFVYISCENFSKVEEANI